MLARGQTSTVVDVPIDGTSHNVRLGNYTFTISALSVPGSAEQKNADTLRVCYDPTRGILLAFVGDGATNLLPLVKDACYASAFVAERLSLLLESSCFEWMLHVNDKLREDYRYDPGVFLDDPNTLPTTLGTVFKIDTLRETVDYAHIGDTWGLGTYRIGLTECFTGNTNKPWDNYCLLRRDEYAATHGLRIEEVLKQPEFRRFLLAVNCDKINRKDLPPQYSTKDGVGIKGIVTGSGAINGQPEMVAFVETVANPLNLRGLTKITFGSDGALTPGLSINALSHRREMIRLLEELGLERYILNIREKELADPDLVDPLRFKLSDDASIGHIIITC